MSIKDGPGEGTWSVFAQKVVEQRDEAREEAANLRKTIEGVSRSLAAVANGWPYEHEPALHVSQALKLACDTIDDLRAQVVKLKQERDEIREGAERLRERVEHNLDWFQQRFNRLRQWVKEEVEPLSEDVARRYFAICANGSPSPHESADWRETMHGLSLERDSLRAENERLTRIVENYDRRFSLLSKIAQGVEEKVGRYLEFHGPSCDEHVDGDDECPTCRMDTAANDAISELKFWSRA